MHVRLVRAQVPPTASESAAYVGLHAAAASGDLRRIRDFIANGAAVDSRDDYFRTPLHVATYGKHHAVMRALVEAGANPNALERDRYDIVTIASVANDVATLKLALELGCSARNITSRYDGTALIAAAHLGWTAVIESIVLGDGGPRHQDTLRALIDAKANLDLPDRSGQRPLQLARSRGYGAMVEMLQKAGAH